MTDEFLNRNLTPNYLRGNAAHNIDVIFFFCYHS